MNEKIKICQSCGMPLVDSKYSGKNKDGSDNQEYCKYCYQDGQFIDEGITLEEKIKKNITIAVNMGMAEEKAIKMANSVIPGLKRWNS